MKKEIVPVISSAIGKANKVAVLTHTNPDGDAMGSALAVVHWLRARGKEIKALVPGMYPDFLAWMPGTDELLVYDRDAKACQQVLEEADLLICVDFNAPDRLEGLQSAFERSQTPKILIDHHIERGHFCEMEYTTTEVSSTAELVMQLMKACGDATLLTRDIGSCLYVGIMTDTGSFSYACNYPSTFLAVAEIVSTGCDLADIHRRVYDNNSVDRMRLMGYCMSEKLVVIPESGTAFIALSAAELKRFNARNGDTEGVVNFTMGLKGIIFGALITERKGKIKFSLRSKGNFDVNLLASRHFNGGGHKNASGGDLYCSFEEAVTQFRFVVAQYNTELKAETERCCTDKNNA